MNRIKHLVVAVASVATLGSMEVQAGGVIGDIVNVFAPGVGTALDQANAALGQPFDHAAAAAANTIVPGSQAAIEAYWAAQRSGMLPNIQGGRPLMAPGMARGAAIAPPSMPMGNFCATPFGRFGPGPFNPVGMSCHVMTPNGPIFGQVSI